MKNKYLVTIIGLVLFGIAIFLIFNNKSQSDQTSNTSPTPTPVIATPTPDEDMGDDAGMGAGYVNKEMLLNSEVGVPISDTESKTVKLTEGKGEWDNGPTDRGSAVLGLHYTEVSTDEGFNLISDAYINTGGSGEFVYITLYRYFADATVLSDWDALGDRVKLESVSVSTNQAPDGNYDLEVKYLTRNEDEPMVNAPTVPVTVKYKVSDHKLERVTD